MDAVLKALVDGLLLLYERGSGQKFGRKEQETGGPDLGLGLQSQPLFML